MRFLLLLALLLQARMLQAHMMSLSSGDAKLEGTRLIYTLTIPLFEVAHTTRPERTLLEHISFSNARLTAQECHTDSAHESYVCRATYEYPSAPTEIEIHCTYPEVTVPNHVHLLRATSGQKHDQAVFDSSFTTATLRFRPPTVAEYAAGQIARGAASAASGPIPALFLITLAAAAASWKRLGALLALFLAGQLVGAILPWQPSPTFLEAAAAVAVAYLAFEVAFLKDSNFRLVLAACLGITPGLVLANYLRVTESSLAWAYLGTAFADIAVATIVAAVILSFPKFRRVPAAFALCASLIWFVVTVSR